MRRPFLFAALAALTAGSLWGYSVFNTRGLGGYVPPVEFLNAAPRHRTRIGVGFVSEFVQAVDSSNVRSGFLTRPERLEFYFPLPYNLGLAAQVAERFDLDFSVQSDSVRSVYTLIRRIEGRGGIEGARVALDKSFYNVFYLCAGYERYFGGAWERWTSEVVELETITTDSLLYHFGGDGVWGVCGVHLGGVRLRGFYAYPFALRVTTEVQTSRDTSTVDSVSYVPPVEFGGLLNYTGRRLSLGFAYIQQSGGEDGGLFFNTGRLAELNAAWRLEALTLTGRAGWSEWYARTADGSAISELYAGLGVRIPIESYGWGVVELKGGLRRGGTLSEYRAELRTGLEFNEIWKKRERMWGG